MEFGTAILLVVLAFLIGLGLMFALFKLVPVFRNKQASKKAERIIKDAEIKSEHIIKNAQLDAKTVTYEMKLEAEKEIKERKQEAINAENKLTAREQSIDRRDMALLEKENNLEEKNAALDRLKQDLNHREQVLKEKLDAIISELEKVSQMSINEAREEIFKRVEEKLSQEIAAFIKNKEDEAKDIADAKARDLLALAVDKYAQEVTTERTVSVVALPSDEMKGRIIGREGRNIRTLEQLLGVDILIDDTPEVITVSCFDPIRRETARVALELLIKDGRIQPGRIEEICEKAKAEVDKSVKEAGAQAALRLGLPRINKDLLTYVGRLKYRTSYGQNVFEHSIQVAYLAGVMAAELGLDQNLAKRAGLLHDVGKAADFEMDGSHVELGVRLAKKYGEPEVVVNAIESHHGDVPAKFVISHLVAAADTLSAARPGARSETLENYIQRIEQIENICKQFEGVSSSFAMQSGREVRVMVVPEKIDDLASFKLARDIKDKIENEMTYPGQIKVSVIRELRATEIAK